MIELQQIGCSDLNAEITIPGAAQAPVQRIVNAACLLWQQVDILILDIEHGTNGREARASKGGDVIGGWVGTNHVRVGATRQAGLIVCDQRIAFTEKTDNTLLLHIPIVSGHSETAKLRRNKLWLQDQAIAVGFGIFRL